MPPLDVKVVPADTDRFGTGHGFNTAPSDGPPAAITQRDREDPRQGAAAGRRGARAPPESLTWRNGAWVERRRQRPDQIKTIADIALYAHGTGQLPPGVEGGLDAQTVYRD